MTAQPTFSPAPQAGSAPAPKRRAGRVVAVVISALVVLAGLGVGALFLFGTKTVDTVSVQQEIDRITRSAVRGRAGRRAVPGGHRGTGGRHVHLHGDGRRPAGHLLGPPERRPGEPDRHLRPLLRLDSVEASLADTVSQAVDVAVTVDCGPAGRTVLVQLPRRAPSPAPRPHASDQADGAQLSATIDADGAVSYRFV